MHEHVLMTNVDFVLATNQRTLNCAELVMSTHVVCFVLCALTYTLQMYGFSPLCAYSQCSSACMEVVKVLGRVFLLCHR